MHMNIRWLLGALTDLDEIYIAIRPDNPPAAEHVLAEIRAAVRRLPEMPNLGRVGRWARTRELVLPPSYIVAYRLTDEAIEIIAVRHVAREWPDEPAA